MKKNYQTPAMMAVKVEISLLQNATSIHSNAGLQRGGEGGTNDVARGRQSSSWDDDDE